MLSQRLYTTDLHLPPSIDSIRPHILRGWAEENIIIYKMIISIDTKTGFVQIEGHIIPEELLEVIHSLMDITFDLQEESTMDKRFTSFTELYRKS